MAEGRLDFLIFGATGFTGLHCIPYVYKFAKDNGRNMAWGVAGRSEEKLKEALEKMGKKVDADLSETTIIVADVKDYDSLVKMAKRAKVVINCCGPYRFFGYPVVKACVEAGTHYVDVSGEPQFIETVELEYNELAREKGIYIVSACGLDSIPCDLGLIHLEDKFDGVINSAVTYINTWNEGNKSSGPAINYGTWHSLVYGLKHAKELSSIRRKLYPTKLPSFKPKLETTTRPHRSSIVDGWVLPFPGADKSVMKRTQRYLYENQDKRPIQVDTFFVLPNFIQTFMTIIMFLVWTLLIKFNFGKQLLLDYPHIFTFGMFRKDVTPSEEMIDSSWFKITFHARGWKERLANKDDQYDTPPNKIVTAYVKGKNPGYGTTCACVVGAALMILTEKDKLPSSGGVYTPGVAFRKTSLMDLLFKNDVSFEIVSEKVL
ncbi:saccharopine dehydrogenase-like oxidoreductase [Diabrotica undecimpunctata]|uniref:saccharopine dehydrogenase-like oxidoreductase n=1 Tax=Diabrotica undecimpunctata TaxID=50387 RepID=UPI003B635C7C